MGLLSFLKTAVIEDPTEKAKASSGPRKQRNPNPTFLGIRLWKDGSVFPSQSAVDKFDLEYRGGTKEIVPAVPAVGKEGDENYVAAKPARTVFVPNPEGTPGNGFDIIDSREWNQYKGEGNLIFLGVVPKNESKVDMFARTGYDAEGKPLTSVMDQGTKTFGTDSLISMVEEVYGTKLDDKKEYVDLAIVSETEGVNIPETFSKPIMFSPKKTARGKDKGTPTYVRRENMPLFLLVPQEVLEASEPEVTIAASNGVTSKEHVADLSA